MTETEWTGGSNPGLMLEFLKDKASERKLRLFAVACCRLSTRGMEEVRNHRAVVTAEQFADDKASADDLAAAKKDAATWISDVAAPHGYQAASRVVSFMSEQEAIEAAKAAGLGQFGSRDYSSIHQAQSNLLREIFGNPFRSISLDPAWLTSKVVRLAQSIYDDRAFERLPALADALEEAGSYDPDKLSHCRGPELHVRGCWVLDLILGKG
jgi:hypothetical protein